MERELFIPGEPVPKARPRVLRSGRAYTPKRTLDYEKVVREAWKSAHGDFSFGRSPLRAAIYFYLKIPESASKKKREQMVSGEFFPTKRPDLDNLQKSILDALNGIAYDDDSQIVDIHVGKFWSEVPCARAHFKEV